MTNRKIFLYNCPRSKWLGLGIFCGLSFITDPAAMFMRLGSRVPTVAVAHAQTIQPLSANDVSWLFPAPVLPDDFNKLIAIRDLTTPDPQDSTKRDPVWPDVAFQQFLGIAASPAALVAGTQSRIGLPAEAQSIDVWHIAGIRIDAGAPGLSDDIRAQFGQLPQIRLILQPVTRNSDGTPKVHDIAAHLIFNFGRGGDPPAQVGCFPRFKPDLSVFEEIVADLAALRTKLSEGQLGTSKITTSGAPMGVHPGLRDTTTASNVRQEMKTFLERADRRACPGYRDPAHGGRDGCGGNAH